MSVSEASYLDLFDTRHIHGGFRVSAITPGDLIAAAAVVQVRATTAPALAPLAQRLLDAAHSSVTDTHCHSEAALDSSEGD